LLAPGPWFARCLGAAAVGAVGLWYSPFVKTGLHALCQIGPAACFFWALAGERERERESSVSETHGSIENGVATLELNCVFFYFNQLKNIFHK
jgi:hypothetical protein